MPGFTQNSVWKSILRMDWNSRGLHTTNGRPPPSIPWVWTAAHSMDSPPTRIVTLNLLRGIQEPEWWNCKGEILRLEPITKKPERKTLEKVTKKSRKIREIRSKSDQSQKFKNLKIWKESEKISYEGTEVVVVVVEDMRSRGHRDGAEWRRWWWNEWWIV